MPFDPGAVFAQPSPTHPDAAEVGLRWSMYPWLFGAETGSHQFHQFKRWRGKFGSRGYVLKPATDATARTGREAAADVGLRIQRRTLR